MRYVVDIDGTICTNRYGNWYWLSQPYLDRIEHMNRLFDAGHEVIYFTARGMSTFKTVEAAIEKLYEFTQEQLEEWGVKYTELIFGKPSGDVYVDDKGVNSEQFF